MKTNKVSASPLLSALIVLLTITLGAMGYVIITDDRGVRQQRIDASGRRHRAGRDHRHAAGA
jgi:hypothetical protein